MPKTHRQILEEAMQAREGILKRERERMEQEEAKEYNLEDMMEECEQKEREKEHDTPYNGAIKKKSIKHKKICGTNERRIQNNGRN